MSAANVRRHKLRSGLTTLGIILGIGAVIGTFTMGTSFEQGFIEAFNGIFNPDGMLLQPGEVRASASQNGFFTTPIPIFTDRDVNETAKAAGVAAAFSMDLLQTDPSDGLRVGNRSVPNPLVWATDPGAIGPTGYRPVPTGRSIEAPGEAVIDHPLALDIAALRNGSRVEDALGERLLFKTASGRTFEATVVGILKESPQGSLSNFVFVHREPWMVKVRPPPSGGEPVPVHEALVVMAEPGRGADAIKPGVLDYLNTRSDAREYLERDAPTLGFVTLTQADITSFIQQQIGQFGGFIGSIGFISLLVGSIGIANTMLVSVTERTREIGVMKATGAKRKDVLQLFLVEASLLCTVGALLGVLLGYLLGYALTQYGFFANENLPLVFRWEWVPLAVGAGVLTGLLSGLYPAWRAASANPVEALRYE